MPIKPANKSLYPAEWPQISRAAKEAVGWRCMHFGCSARQYDFGYWITGPDQNPRWVRIGGPCMTWSEARQRAAEEHFARFGDGPGDVKIIVIVLTTAHLDHDPKNCSPENLVPMCQRHHLACDLELHKANAQATRRANNLSLELFNH